MPYIDMPLDELKLYRGINPRPADFDEYWESALDEMKAVYPNIEIKPASFRLNGFDCKDLYFTGVRGSRIHAKIIMPAGRKNLPIALHFHGYTGRSQDWNEYIAFAAAGFCVFAMDCRGQGGQSEDMGGVKGNTLHGHIIRGLESGADELLFRHVFLDTVQLSNIAMAMNFTDETRICAYGSSQGGALTLACSALNPQIRILAPAYPFLCDYKRVWQLNLYTPAYIELWDYFRMFDPLHKREEEIFTVLGYIDVVNLANRICGETLFAVSLEDDICPPSTSFAAYNNIQAKKDIRIYPDYKHEFLPGFNDEVIQKFQQALAVSYPA
nr:acetylxylan esterase [uncultured bacterium]